MAKLPPYTKCFPPKTKQELEQESSLYNNYDSLISTLPRSSDSLVQLSLFNGFWFPNGAGLSLKILHGTLAASDHFHPLPGDILLSSLPKVGTTRFKALAFATLHRSKKISPPSSSPSTLTNASLPSNTRSMPITVSLTSTPSPPLVSSPPTSPTRYCRFLSSNLNHVVKLSTSVETQWTRSYQCGSSSTTLVPDAYEMTRLELPDAYEMTRLEDFLEVFLAGVYTSGPFSDSVIEYWSASRESAERVMFMKYEDLKRSPEAEVKRLAGEEEEGGAVERIVRLCSLGSLRGMEVNQMTKTELWSAGFDNRLFFGKGEVGDWRNYLTPEMAERFRTVTEERFGAIGLSFEFCA